MNKISYGSDPEMMIQEIGTGRIVSSMNVLGGRTKHKPIELGDGIKTYADNALIECSFPPSDSTEGAVAMIGAAFTRTQEHLGDKFTLMPKASHVYDKEELQCQEVWESGCNPNYDVYAKAMNLPADFTSCLRTGSFHIHVGDERLVQGFVKPEEPTPEQMQAIKLLDVILGCSSIIFDKDESAPARRALYGRAGEYRPCKYGIEYRVLGNWPLGSPQTTKLCFDLVEYAMNVPMRERELMINEAGEQKVQTAINTNNAKMALKCIFDAGMPYKLMERVTRAYKMPSFNLAWGI